MRIEIRPCRVADRIAEITALSRAHAAETEPALCGDGPAPCADAYLEAERIGALIALAAFDEHDAVVGYAVAMVMPHAHYGYLYAQHDLLYVVPECRKGTAGGRLMKAVEAAARDKGARFMLWHAKPGSAFDHVLQRAGFAVEEIVYRKEF